MLKNSIFRVLITSLVLTLSVLAGLFFFIQDKKEMPESRFKQIPLGAENESLTIIDTESNCDLSQIACEKKLPNGEVLKIKITPNPIYMEESQSLTAQLIGASDWTPVAVDFNGQIMDMEFLRPKLESFAENNWRVDFKLSTCGVDSMIWKATVLMKNKDKNKDSQKLGVIFYFQGLRSKNSVSKDSAEIQVVSTNSQLRPEPVGGDFTLQSMDGDFRLSSLKGQVVLIYFGFISCPDVCPTTLSNVTAAFKKLDAQDLNKVKLLFVDVDPERDTLKKIVSYTSVFHKNIIPLVGDLESLKRVASSFGAYFNKVDLKSKMNYTIDHTTSLFVVDQQGKFIGRISHSAMPEEIALKVKATLSGKTIESSNRK